MTFVTQLLATLLSTLIDLTPIIAIILGFQTLVIREPLPHLRELLIGLGYVWLGLALFLIGLDLALFPLGRLMAEQLTATAFAADGTAALLDQLWIYLFAFAIGLSTTIAEPSLIAVALKAEQVSGGAIGGWGLRLAVALGVAVGITLGVYRIISGTPLQYYILCGYVVVVVQTFLAPRSIVPLAYDSGGVTTSTVTVPLVTALGLGLAEQVPGRSVLIDGFGLIAFASLFPIIAVLGYAQLGEWLSRRVDRETDPQ